MSVLSSHIRRLATEGGVLQEGTSLRSYSGRNMFGKYCPAFCSDLPSSAINAKMMSRAAYLLKDNLINDEDFAEITVMMSQMKSDELGKSRIYYFPEIEFDNEDMFIESLKIKKYPFILMDEDRFIQFTESGEIEYPRHEEEATPIPSVEAFTEIAGMTLEEFLREHECAYVYTPVEAE